MTPAEAQERLLASAERAERRRARLIAARGMPYERMLAVSDAVVLEQWRESNGSPEHH